MICNGDGLRILCSVRKESGLSFSFDHITDPSARSVTLFIKSSHRPWAFEDEQCKVDRSLASFYTEDTAWIFCILFPSFIRLVPLSWSFILIELKYIFHLFVSQRVTPFFTIIGQKRKPSRRQYCSIINQQINSIGTRFKPRFKTNRTNCNQYYRVLTFCSWQGYKKRNFHHNLLTLYLCTPFKIFAVLSNCASVDQKF